MAKRKTKAKNKYFDLIFTFKYVCATVDIDADLYDKEEQQKIKQILLHMTKEMSIDKSYVLFKDNKHEDTFMLESGWNSLCKLVIDTNFGKNATFKENEIMMEAYVMMILCYIYLYFENLGYGSDGIFFSLAYGKKFMVLYNKDITEEWKYYPGKWQDWHKRSI